MANNLVAFLRQYGPISTSDAMYDEFIQSELKRFGIDPAIEIPPARLETLREIYLKGDAGNVVLTGTAGDGKTFHCRRIWEELGGTDAGWTEAGKIARIDLPSGRSLVVVKDMSELKDSEKAEIMPDVSAAVRGRAEGPLYLIAANDGQLLATWRQWAEPRGGGDLDAFRRIEAMLVDGQTTHDELDLRLFNLSRQDATDHFNDLIEQVVEHPQWADCESCPLMSASANHACPIRINRERLRGDSPFRRRLLELLTLAAANRLHLPIRHLLLLTVNILLGDSKPPQRLLTCRTARNRADQRDYRATNPYANVFGGNLPEAARGQYQAFTVFESFGVGQETDNAFDNLLIYGPHADPDRYDRLVDADAYYGGPAYRRLLDEYLEGDRANTRDFLHALERQRQRLFFSLPADEALDPWQLTVYRNAARFLSFRNRLAQGADVNDVAEALIRGLNRTFCGMMIDDANEVLLASSGGDGRGKIASVLNYRTPARPNRRDIYMRFDLPADAATPRLAAVDPIGRGDGVIDALDLQLTHFEYLMRVANGSLPASFSRQCFEDFLDFKLRLIEKLDHVVGPPEPRPDQVEFRAITVDDRGRAQVDNIPIRTGT
jgi:hypothetical protein